MNYPYRNIDFLKSSNVVNLSRTARLKDLSPLINAEILILRDIHQYNINLLLFGLCDSNIQYLDLSHTNLGNTGLYPLQNIKKLILSNCKRIRISCKN